MNKVTAFLRSAPLSPEALATRSKLSLERVRAIVDGTQDATLSELRALARALKIPVSAFAKRTADSDLALLFRQSADQRADLGVEKASAFVEAALTILPRLSVVPQWFSEFRAREETYEEANRLAEEFRTVFTPERPDDPLTDLPALLVDRCDMVLSRLETSKFEGASVVSDGYAFIFVSPRFSGRMLFTLAHELGHLVAHHDHGRAIVFDLSSQIGGTKRHRSTSEAFVDAFASALLMPARGVGRALQQIRQAIRADSDAVGDVELLYLARFYGVGFDTAALRCEKLGLLPSGSAWALSDHLKKNHKGAERRADALGLPRREPIAFPRVSRNLLAVAAEKIDAGQLSLGWVTDKLSCSATEVYAARAPREVRNGPYH